MPAVKPEDRITQSDKELHVGLAIPVHSARQISNWARNQDWPEGTELEQPREYHITLLYTPEGHDQHKDAWWIEHMDQTEVTTTGVKAFSSQEKGGYAYVLTVDSDDVKQKAEEMQGRAEWAGLPITKFPGGYKPHITVGYGPSSRLTGITPPNFQFDVGPSSVSPPRIKESVVKTAYDELEGLKDPVPPSVGYHFHAPGMEANIRQHGIEPTQSLGYMNPLGNGVYMYDHDPRSIHHQGAGDLYQIDLSGMEHELTPDFEIEGSWHHPGPIPPERIHRIAKVASKAPSPPNLRHHEKAAEKCSTCKMFDHAKKVCWGFGNKEVSPEAVCDDWYPESKRSAYDPQHVEILDHLSLTNVAANLHYKFAEGGMDASQATDYAKRLLKLIGYPPDDITVQAALQAWQQSYPDDKILESGSDPGQLPAPPTTPQESYGYGTKSKVAWQSELWDQPYYHIAPQHAREQIQQQGLHAEDWQDPAYVWLMDDLDRARQQQAAQNKFRPHDIWGVQPTGTLERDPHPGTPITQDYSWVHDGPIPPDRLSLQPPEKFAHSSGELCYSLPDSFSRIGALPTQQPLYHWLDASQIHDWMDPAHTGPGQTFLTETGDDPSAKWNDDIPHFDNPVRLTIDPERLDPNLLDQTYEGWLGNHLYQGPIPHDSVVDIKGFKQPDAWHEDFSTVPSQVNDPEDHWPEFGQTPPDKKRDIEFSNDWNWHQ